MISAGKPDGPVDERLDSWKQIAAFFGRDERTVKRWEARRGLPLHRLPGGGGAKVYAFRGELQAWLHRGGGGREDDADTRNPSAAFARRAPAADERRPHGNGPAVLIVLMAILTVAAFLIGRARWPIPGGGVLPVQANSSARPAHDPLAVEFYRTGLYYWHARTPESLHQAVDYFTQAIVRDPAYAEPYAGLADSYNLLREFSEMPAREAYPRAKAAAERAIAIDPDLAEAHASLGFVDFYWSRDTPAALKEFERALNLDPRSAIAHHWYANVLATLGRSARALDEIGVAQSLDPGSSAVLADRGFILMTAGRTDEAITLLESMEQTTPQFLSPHRYLAVAYLTRDRDADAVREMETAARLQHDDRRLAIASAAERGLAAGGRRGMLKAMLTEKRRLYAEGGVSAFELAGAYAAIGDGGEALSLLRASVDRREPENVSLDVDPAFAGLRGEDEFRRLRQRVNTPRPAETTPDAPASVR